MVPRRYTSGLTTRELDAYGARTGSETTLAELGLDLGELADGGHHWRALFLTRTRFVLLGNGRPGGGRSRVIERQAGGQAPDLDGPRATNLNTF